MKESSTPHETKEYLYHILEQLSPRALSEVTRFVEGLQDSAAQDANRDDRTKIHAEARAFRAMHRQLIEKHLGRYVAIHEGQLVDDDQDRRKLYLRVRAKYGIIPVLIRQVTRTPEREFHILNPCLEHDSR